ncbi:MAG: MBL fold metallo-hydrolase [Deltaproteobacteria bacterium HGW-Deltaproteobacteria-4]|nr:MAG: MBL fold metallo-hydrolase [Deltaproteobacteria bacterium HGW-Deltaproteobacteria-4]
MILEAHVVGPLQVNSFIVGCEVSKAALVIDPGEEGERILARLAALGLQLKMIINTHGHFDHIGANRLLMDSASGVELLIHGADAALFPKAQEHGRKYGLEVRISPSPTRLLQGGETITVGTLQIQVIATPGHTPGGISLLIDDHLFSGDTLFADSVGRTDLPGGDHDTLVASIRQELFILPDETIVHPGHGPDTTIGREKKLNPYVGIGA